MSPVSVWQLRILREPAWNNHREIPYAWNTELYIKYTGNLKKVGPMVEHHTEHY
jgi:hypothetical protein